MKICLVGWLVFWSIGAFSNEPAKHTMSNASTPRPSNSCYQDSHHFSEFSQFAESVRSCVRVGNFSEALRAALQANKFAEEKQDPKLSTQAQLMQAAALQYMGLYHESLNIYTSILNNSAITDQSIVATAENNAAALLLELGQLQTSKTLAESALARHIKNSDVVREVYSLSTLADIHLALKDLESAQKSLDTCLEKSALPEHLIANLYCNQTLAKLLYERKQFRESLAKANLTIDLALQSQMRQDLADIYFIKAQAESALDRDATAIESATVGIEIAEEQRDLDSAIKGWLFLENVYSKNMQWENAHNAVKKLHALNSELFNQKLTNTVAYQQVQLEMEKKEKEINALKQENQLHQAESETAKAQRTAVIAFSISLLAIVFVGYSRWIHKRDLARAEKTNAELHHLNELKDQFLSNTSHELRTPLNGIIGLSDILSETEATTLSSMGRTQLGLIRDCGVQLSEMVDSILDFSQIRAGKHVVHVEAISLNDIMQKVFAILQPLAQRKSLTFELDLPKKDVTVLADANRLRQILINLVGNAIKFTDNGVVSLVANVNNQGVAIQVRDSGVGIPSDRLQSIFEPFEQVDGSLRRRNGGVGLGLAIAKELVKAHGSELKVNSVVGVGTEFGFTLSEA